MDMESDKVSERRQQDKVMVRYCGLETQMEEVEGVRPATELIFGGWDGSKI